MQERYIRLRMIRKEKEKRTSDAVPDQYTRIEIRENHLPEFASTRYSNIPTPLSCGTLASFRDAAKKVWTSDCERDGGAIYASICASCKVDIREC